MQILESCVAPISLHTGPMLYLRYLLLYYLKLIPSFQRNRFDAVHRAMNYINSRCLTLSHCALYLLYVLCLYTLDVLVFCALGV